MGVKARRVDSDARCQFGFCALWKFGVGSGAMGVRMSEVGGCAPCRLGTWNRLSAQREMGPVGEPEVPPKSQRYGPANERYQSVTGDVLGSGF